MNTDSYTLMLEETLENAWQQIQLLHSQDFEALAPIFDEWRQLKGTSKTPITIRIETPLDYIDQQSAMHKKPVEQWDEPEPKPDELLRDNALERFQKKAYEKFNYGMAEHNPFNDRPLTQRASFNDLEDEIIDLWMYVQAIKKKLNQ